MPISSLRPTITAFIFAVCLSLFTTAPARAQSDPSTFTNVFNIGTVPPGSPFDVLGATSGTSAGGTTNTVLTPTDLSGAILDDDSQLNLFDGGTITGIFDVGPRSTFGFLEFVPPQNVGLNTELNVFGGKTETLIVNANARANINGGDIGALDLRGGSVVTINNGNVGVGLDNRGFPGFLANPDAVVVINGGNFTGGFNATIRSDITINGGSFSVQGDEDFISSNSLTVTGGSFGNGLTALESLNISGGSFGNDLRVGAIGNNTGTATISNATIGRGFRAASNTVVEIFGDTTFGDDFRAGGDLTVSSGVFGSGFTAGGSDTNVAISGGLFGEDFVALGNVTFTGGEFQRNGLATTDLTAGLLPGSTDVVTGVLADGNVFIFSSDAQDEFSSGTTAQVVDVAPSTNPGVLSSGVFSQGLRAGETMTVSDAGQLGENFAVVGATLNISGGSSGAGIEAAFSEVNISGGSIGPNLRAFRGSTINITGGSIGSGPRAFAGSTINIAGGNTLEGFMATADSEVNIDSGGSIGANFNSFGTVNIESGSIGSDFSASSGSTVTLTDGFIGPGFLARGFSTVNIEGGEIESLTAAAFSSINLSDGTINDSFGLTGQANISGGSINGRFSISNNPSSPGVTGVANISGGTFNGSIFATGDGTLNISGGTFELDFTFINGGFLNLIGSEFFLNGVELSGLNSNEAFTIIDRNVELTGLLADGSTISLDLNDTFTTNGDTFLNATIAVTSVPEPSSLCFLSLTVLALLTKKRKRQY